MLIPLSAASLSISLLGRVSVQEQRRLAAGHAPALAPTL
jgi:hypothetical protein